MRRTLAPGTYPLRTGEPISFSEADLRGAAEAYDPKLKKAPIVLGHPSTDSPAFGYVANAEFSEGWLKLDPLYLSDKFAAFAEESYGGGSVALYKPDSYGNPIKDGKTWYIRHWGWANWPVIKGSEPPTVAEAFSEFDPQEEGVVVIQFSEFSPSEKDGENQSALGEGKTPSPDSPEFSEFFDRQVVELFRSIRDWMIEWDNVEAADRLIPSWALDMMAEEIRLSDLQVNAMYAEEPVKTKTQPTPASPPPDGEAKNDTRSAQASQPAIAFAEQEASLTQRETALDKRLQALDRREMVAFCEDLLNAGRQFDKAAAVELLLSSADEGEVAFGEGDTAFNGSPRELVKRLLNSLPKVVEFAEVAGAEKTVPDQETDPKAIARKIDAYRRQQAADGAEVSFAEASAYVSQHPEFQG